MIVLASGAAAAVLGLMLALPARPRTSARRGTAASASDTAMLLRLRVPLTALAFVGGWTFIGDWAGVAGGALLSAFAWRILGSVESPATRRRREQLERDLPFAVHLFGGCLVSGSAITSALEDVASALPGPVAEELRLVRRRLLLGADPREVWASLDGSLNGLGRSMARAERNGSSVRDAVERLADELHSDARVRAEALARTIEVRTAVPLGVCFLPAFVILGVVPMVAGIFSSLHVF